MVNNYPLIYCSVPWRSIRAQLNNRSEVCVVLSELLLKSLLHKCQTHVVHTQVSTYTNAITVTNWSREQYWYQQVVLRSSAAVNPHCVKIQGHYGLSQVYFTEHSQLGSNSEVKNLHLFMTALFIFYYSFISFSEDSQCQWVTKLSYVAPQVLLHFLMCVLRH